MKNESKILVTGKNGMVGSAIVRLLKKNGYNNVIPVSRDKVDLLSQKDTEDYFNNVKPDYVFCAAAKVGGIKANSEEPASFIYENLMVQSNVIHSAYKVKVKKLLFLGSSCIYPKLADQPMKEEALLSGTLEPTNEPYAIAKIAGIRMCDAYKKQYGCNFVSAMPTNLFGYGDNFNLESSHVLPALIRRFHEAKLKNDISVTCWGTGKAMREFLFIDDLAEAVIFVMQNFDGPGFLNVGSGKDCSIFELTKMIAELTDYKGEILWDNSKPDGTPKKLLDISKIQNLGWQPRFSLKEGLKLTYKWYLENLNNVRK